MTNIAIIISGMNGNSCAETIEQNLLAMPGVTQAKVNYTDGEVDIRFKEEELEIAELHGTIESWGYQLLGYVK